MKPPTSVENRVWFCNYLRHLNEHDFMHLAPADEFYTWTVHRPNYQNNRMWVLSLEDIESDERYQDVCAKPNCIGVFIYFTAIKLMWVIKDNGASWDGTYYRHRILTEEVIPFLSNSENVLDSTEVVHLHDNAPCHKTNATQQLLKNSEIKFFDRTKWPGSSPNVNVAENVGSILMDKVESLIINEHGSNRNSSVVLLEHLQNVLNELKNQKELFESLLKSYHQRLKAVCEVNGGHAIY